MQVIAVWIYAGLIRTVFLVEFFNKEPAAFRTVLVNRLEMTDKVTGRIIRTAVEFLSASFCFSRNNLAVTTRHRTFCKRNRLCIMALRKS